MIEREVPTVVDDDVTPNIALPNEPDETAIQALAGRLGDIGTILNVLAEAIDDRDQIIADLSQRVSDLEQNAQCAPS